jgi:ATP-binding cassette subfamily B protein
LLPPGSLSLILKNEIYEQYQRLSINFYKKNRTGDLMNRISEDVSKVRMYFGPAIMYSMNMIFLFIVGFTQMIKTDPILTLYTPYSLSLFYQFQYFTSAKSSIKEVPIVKEYLSRLTTYNQEFFIRCKCR